MAEADYYSCDKCGCRLFYDADLEDRLPCFWYDSEAEMKAICDDCGKDYRIVILSNDREEKITQRITELQAENERLRNPWVKCSERLPPEDYEGWILWEYEDEGEDDPAFEVVWQDPVLAGLGLNKPTNATRWMPIPQENTNED